MKIVRIVLTILACAIWGVSIFLSNRWSAINDRIVTSGQRHPSPETGEVYEILYRGGTTRYVTETEAWIHHLNFAVVPLCIVAGIWIVFELHRAGLLNWSRR